MSKEREVKSFLSTFKSNLDIFGILYLDRSKNAQALLDLDIIAAERDRIIKDIKPEDYCEGPKEEKIFNQVEYWVFGKKVKSHEVYIKISLGNYGSKVICISFHIAEHPMKYPLKT